MSLPNMIGDHDMNSLQSSISSYMDLKHSYPYISSQLPTGGCFKHRKEVLCQILFPRCDHISNQVIPICKEMCSIFLNSCLTVLKPAFYSVLKTTKYEKWKKYADRNISDEIDCNYLPSVNDPIPCYYKPVTCDTPPNVTNARIINGSEHDRSYLANFQAHYECVDKTFQMEGNSTVTCMYSGFWSETPRCSSVPDSSSTNPLLFVFPILIIPLCLWVVLCLFVWSRKGKSGYIYYRHKEYDAFVCYDIADAEYAHETIIDELEKKSDSPFKTLYS